MNITKIEIFFINVMIVDRLVYNQGNLLRYEHTVAD